MGLSCREERFFIDCSEMIQLSSNSLQELRSLLAEKESADETAKLFEKVRETAALI
jgi:hypothetical protein